MTMQIRAHFGMIDQFQSDVGAHAGKMEGLKGQLMQEVSQALGNMDGDMNSDTHQRAMKIAQKMIDEYISSQNQHQVSTANAGNEMLAAGTKGGKILAGGA